MTFKIKVLMPIWEHPPVLVGGLGRHVHAPATGSVRAGHEVTVGTPHAPGAAPHSATATGGVAEIVRPGVTGVTFPAAGDPAPAEDAKPLAAAGLLV